MDVILAAVLPVLITTLVGYGLARTGRSFDARTMTFVIAAIGTPALVFNNLSQTRMAPDALLSMAGATLTALAVFLLAGGLTLKAMGLRLPTYLPSLAFANTGNLGLPLAFYAAGQEGLNYAIVFFAIISIANFTLGQLIAAGTSNWTQMFRSPIVPAVALGVYCAYGGIVLPVWLANTLSLLEDMTIPLMLLMLGMSLAKIEVTMVSRAVILSAVRIGMGVAAGFALSYAFGFEGTERLVFVLQCAMPVAVYNYLFAQMWNNEPAQIASLIVVSTLMSVVTVPVLLAILAA